MLGALARPLFVYSRSAIEAAYDAYRDGMGGHPHLICYAVKANSSLAILQLLAQRGAGFDIGSGGELARVLRAGGDPRRVVFSGVAKSGQEMRDALEANILCFNVESANELRRLNAVAAELGRRASISLRVNPDVDADTHPYISTGLKENKFGIDIDTAESVFSEALALPFIDPIGIGCHIGSQLQSTGPFVDALDRLLILLERLESTGVRLQHLDVGGGLGVRYRDETPPSAQEYLSALLERLGARQHCLIVEPGRSIVANAGVMLTRVIDLKTNGSRQFAIVDAAMNDLIRPALYDAWLDIVAVQPRVGERRRYDIVGPVCETGDFLGKSRELVLEEQDLLARSLRGSLRFQHELELQ